MTESKALIEVASSTAITMTVERLTLGDLASFGEAASHAGFDPDCQVMVRYTANEVGVSARATRVAPQVGVGDVDRGRGRR